MIGTRLLIDKGEATPLGRLHVAGTLSGTSRVTDRVLHEYAWVYVVSGQAYYRDELGVSVTLSAGDGLIIYPGIRHSNGAAPGSSWEHIYFVFDGPIFNLLESTQIFKRHAPVMKLKPVDLWVDEILSFANQPRPASGRDRTLQIVAFAQLLVSAVLQPTKQSTWIEAAYARLSLDISTQLDMAEAARSLGMGYESFRKHFRREAGISPGRYRESVRMSTATELLRSTSLTLRQIAATLGYSDEFHLSKRFKTESGLSPTEYRTLVKGTLANPGNPHDG